MNLSYRILGYIAIWPAMYTLGVFLIAGRLIAGGNPPPQSFLFVLLCAHSCYLIDRVKVTDHRQDPADAMALPIRAFLFAKFSHPIRFLVVLELLAATLLGWSIYPPLGLVPIAALVVVHMYAGRGASPSSPRLKDLPAIKAFVIASGHLALAIAVLWSHQHELLGQLNPRGLAAALGIWLIVAGDAVLCDIDDQKADKAFATQSLAVLFGPRGAWISAIVLLALGLLCLGFNQYEQGASIVIGSALMITTIITHTNTNHRDFVDFRLLPIVLISIWLSSP